MLADEGASTDAAALRAGTSGGGSTILVGPDWTVVDIVGGLGASIDGAEDESVGVGNGTGSGFDNGVSASITAGIEELSSGTAVGVPSTGEDVASTELASADSAFGGSGSKSALD